MSTPVTTALNPWGPISRANRVRVHQSGRVCAHAGCATILSIYNPAKYCSVHLEQAQGRRRGVLTVVGASRPGREVPDDAA